MLSDFDKQALQAGFDGELDAREWRRLQDNMRDSEAASAYLAELETIHQVLDGAQEVPVPSGLTDAIKQSIPAQREVHHSRATLRGKAPGARRPLPPSGSKPAAAKPGVSRAQFGRGRDTRQPGAAVNWAGGLALAASLVMAVGLGVQFYGGSELGMDSHMRSRMTGALVDPAAMEAAQHWQWDAMDTRIRLMRSAAGLTLELEADADPAADLVLLVSGDQWRWRQDAASADLSTGRGAAPRQLRLAVNGEQRYRLELEPATRDGEIAQGSLPAPRIKLEVQRDGHLLDRAEIVPD